ncbi:MAG: tRNA (adenosine(37)-N6)-threonylcarbamoyltransferase complex ATPase subunit type 1 TsaE [Solirubrobacteraceae bacterium]
METYTSNNLDDLNSIAKKITDNFKYKIICLNGELGSGKTTLVKNILTNFEVLNQVSSPTYSIVNEYTNKNDEKIYHFDFYRIHSIEEAFDIGFEEYLEANCYCFIEWPNLILDFLPLYSYHEISITKNEFNRIISFK